MARFSHSSASRLATCHIDLQRLFTEVIKTRDCTILCGERGEEEQTKPFNEGHSTVEYPKSRHNRKPSDAVDVAPYPIDWEDIDRFCEFAGYVLRVAEELGIKVKWGGNWTTFKDYPHWQT
jgi:peptidoglycan L-alanyl-D-glutamate endopeptidase CwlK